MDGKDNMHMCGCGGSCNCGCGMGHKHRGYWIAKKVFWLLVLIVVFCFGIQLGELRTLSREFSQPRMMGMYGNMSGNMMYNRMGTSTMNQ